MSVQIGFRVCDNGIEVSAVADECRASLMITVRFETNADEFDSGEYTAWVSIYVVQGREFDSASDAASYAIHALKAEAEALAEVKETLTEQLASQLQEEGESHYG